nr:hypothetical protein [Tanacetum cinerariifolium]
MYLWDERGYIPGVQSESGRIKAELPMLTAPKEKEELIIYLAAAKEAVSAVLMTERVEKQMPIYFVSRALQGPEINYTPMEKLILALVNFIVERPKDDPRDIAMKDEEVLPDPWILFTDGSSCIFGSRAGLIIPNPEEMEFTYALRLMANQVNETYVAKEPSMGENKKTDALSKIASTSFAHLSKQGLMEELKENSIDEKEVLAVVEEERRTWMTPIHEYLIEGILPKERNKQGLYAVKQEGSCSMHASPRFVVASPKIRVLLTNYAHGCQKANKGMQRLSEGPGKVKFLIVAIDYFTKWIEAKLVATIMGAQIKNNEETPFLLTYGAEAMIPVEIGMPTLRTTEVDVIKNDEALGVSLDLLEEKREHEAIQEAKSKAKMEKYYNVRVRNTSFRLGDLVYRNNDASRAKDGGKLEPK